MKISCFEHYPVASANWFFFSRTKVILSRRMTDRMFWHLIHPVNTGSMQPRGISSSFSSFFSFNGLWNKTLPHLRYPTKLQRLEEKKLKRSIILSERTLFEDKFIKILFFCVPDSMLWHLLVQLQLGKALNLIIFGAQVLYVAKH